MEPVAILGMSCRFPGAPNPSAYWQLLCEGRDAIREVPADRWDVNAFYDPDPATPGKMVSCRGGFLDEVDKFDPLFFHISPREAVWMDPQQRLILELSWEALEDSGLVPAHLRGSSTGVFFGFGVPEYQLPQQTVAARINSYTNTGWFPCVLSNRVSYVFDFRGPSVSLDTACSSSLTAIHLACQSLQRKESTLALAGGINLMLSPVTTIGYSKLTALSPDGCCKTFDAAANGYVRGEGGGVVVLKLLSEALKDGDEITAIIRGSAINQDGRTNGLTAPNRFSQESVLRQAYAQAAVSPGQIQYVEAHGTGTLLGDPIEAMALGVVLADGRPPGNRCAIGSVKTNIGHLEAAAGIASFIKVALAIRHHMIPPSLHFRTPNPHIPFDKLPLKVQQTLEPWPEGCVLAGVSAFGFGGSNAHLVLGEAPQRMPDETETSPNTPGRAYLLPLSAHTPEALRAMAHSYREFLASKAAEHPGILEGICSSTARHRSHHDYRLSIVADSVPVLTDRLDAFLMERPTAGVSTGRRRVGRAPRVAFLFPGTGSPYVNLGRGLYESYPVFRQTLQCCEELFQPFLDQPLLSVLYPSSGLTSAMDDSGFSQLALFSLEYSLAQQWRAWGVEPGAVMGHGIGEYVAACVAGILSLEDALALIAQQGSWTRQLPPVGSARKVNYSPSRICFISIITGEPVLDSGIDASYWGRPVNQPGPSAAGMQTLHKLGFELFVEISPHPTFRDMVESTGLSGIHTWLPSLCQGREDNQQFLESLGALYVRYLDVNWTAVYSSPRLGRLSLPAYPFQRERFWWDQVSEVNAFDRGTSSNRRPRIPNELEDDTPTRNGRGQSAHPLLGIRLRAATPIYESAFDSDALPWLNDHRVQDLPVVPGAAWLEMALAAADTIYQGVPVGLRDVVFEEMLLLPPSHRRVVQLTLTSARDDKNRFEIHSLADSAGETSAWTLHAHGRITPGESVRAASPPLSDLRFRLRKTLAPDMLYEQLRERGLHYGSTFRSLEQVYRRDREALGVLHLHQKLAEQSGYRVHPVLLDAVFQLVAAALPTHDLQASEAPLFVPTGLAALCLHHRPPTSCWGHVFIRRINSEGVEADLRLLDETGEALLDIVGFRLESLRRKHQRTGIRSSVAKSAGMAAIDTRPPHASALTREALLATDEPRRRLLLQDYLRNQLAQLLRISESELDDVTPLQAFGLDSLMLLGLEANLSRALGSTIKISGLIEGGSIATLTPMLLEEISQDTVAPATMH